MARKFLKCALSKTKKFATTGNAKCSTRPWHNHTKGQKRWQKKASTKKKKKLSRKAMRKKYGYEALPIKKVAGKPVRVRVPVKRFPRVDYAKLAGGK
jgi:hypothetical protein